MVDLSTRIKRALMAIPLTIAPFIPMNYDELTPIDLPTHAQQIKAETEREPIAKDEESGIELSIFCAIPTRNQGRNIYVIAKDTSGEDIGIDRIELFEEGKRIHVLRDGRILKRHVNKRKTKRKFHAVIYDKDGNKLKSTDMIIDFNKKVKRGGTRSSEHEIRGHTPPYLEAYKPESYDKGSLKFKIGNSEIMVPGFYSRGSRCGSCHTPETLETSLTSKLRQMDQSLQEMWGHHETVLPRDIIFNPATLARITPKEEEWIKEELGKDYTDRAKAMIKAFSATANVGGTYREFNDVAVMKIGANSLDAVLMHELAHSLQAKFPLKLSENGKKHTAVSFLVAEPFAYFITARQDPYAVFGWMLSQKEQLGVKKHSTNIEHIFEYVRTYLHYFDVKNQDELGGTHT